MVFVVTAVSASATAAKSSVFIYPISFFYSYPMAFLPFTFYVTMLSFSEGITKASRQRRRLRKEEKEDIGK